MVVDGCCAEEKDIGGVAKRRGALMSPSVWGAEVMRFIDDDEGGFGDVWYGWGAESFCADEVQCRIGFACGVAPAGAEAGGCDDEWLGGAQAGDSECDVGLAGSGRVCEQSAAEYSDSVLQPVDGGNLMWQERDVTECDWFGAELERAGAERVVGEVVDEWVAVGHDAARDWALRWVRSVRSLRRSLPLHASRGATALCSMR